MGLRKFPEDRFSAIIVALGALVIVLGLTARRFLRWSAPRRKAVAKPRVEPTLAHHEPAVRVARIEPSIAGTAPRAPASKPSAWNLEALVALEPQRFEALCAACFEILGFEARAAPPGSERRAQLRLHWRGAERPFIAVRCDAARGVPVDVGEVYELLAALDAEGADEGILVTPGTFTRAAHRLADGKRLRLVEGRDLLWKIDRLSEKERHAVMARVDRVPLKPSCAACDAPPPGGEPLAPEAKEAEHARSRAAAAQESEYCSRVMLP